MDADIQLISDGDGLAVIGSPTAVDLFLAAEQLASKNLGLPRLGAAFKVGAQVAQAYPEIADMAGRCVELTKESAHLLDKHGLKKSSASGVSTAVVKAGKGNGQAGGVVGFAKDSVAQLSKNPAVLSGAAGLMAQLAMQQTMDEITDYLATIDAKLDALKAHASQMGNWERVAERVRARAAEAGAPHGVAYAEVFKRLELPQ